MQGLPFLGHFTNNYHLGYVKAYQTIDDKMTFRLQVFRTHYRLTVLVIAAAPPDGEITER